jgi:hypothetical protein
LRSSKTLPRSPIADLARISTAELARAPLSAKNGIKA